jgi:hypothetical protein
MRSGQGVTSFPSYGLAQVEGEVAVALR